MSYRCPVTKRVRPHGEKPINVILERRERVYYASPDGKPGRDEVEQRDYPAIGAGWEVVRELLVSREGLEQLRAEHPSLVASNEPTAPRKKVSDAGWALPSTGGA